MRLCCAQPTPPLALAQSGKAFLKTRAPPSPAGLVGRQAPAALLDASDPPRCAAAPESRRLAAPTASVCALTAPLRLRPLQAPRRAPDRETLVLPTAETLITAREAARKVTCLLKFKLASPCPWQPTEHSVYQEPRSSNMLAPPRIAHIRPSPTAFTRLSLAITQPRSRALTHSQLRSCLPLRLTSTTLALTPANCAHVYSYPHDVVFRRTRSASAKKHIADRPFIIMIISRPAKKNKGGATPRALLFVECALLRSEMGIEISGHAWTCCAAAAHQLTGEAAIPARRTAGEAPAKDVLARASSLERRVVLGSARLPVEARAALSVVVAPVLPCRSPRVSSGPRPAGLAAGLALPAALALPRRARTPREAGTVGSVRTFV